MSLGLLRNCKRTLTLPERRPSHLQFLPRQVTGGEWAEAEHAGSSPGWNHGSQQPTDRESSFLLPSHHSLQTQRTSIHVGCRKHIWAQYRMLGSSRAYTEWKNVSRLFIKSNSNYLALRGWGGQNLPSQHPNKDLLQKFLLMTGRSICLLSLHFSALKLYSPLFLSCFSPLDSPWKYKFPLECLFKWMLYLFNSYTRNLEICFFFHSRRIFWQEWQGSGRKTFIHL